jgi:hypothetical protein
MAVFSYSSASILFGLRRFSNTAAKTRGINRPTFFANLKVEKPENMRAMSFPKEQEFPT